MNSEAQVVILGSGVAGLSASYHLAKKNIPSIIYEKNNDWGGLCGNFSIDGFRFDKFVHFSFTKDEYAEKIFTENTPFFEHPPEASNYYKGTWLEHPAQNNLYPLSLVEKSKIIFDFIKRPRKAISEIDNYETWLRCQYGNYFAENFPLDYTVKYWGTEAKNLETKWVGQRMHCPSLKEIISGAIKKVKKNYYYASIMRYPKTGGFRSFLDDVRKDLYIKFNKEVAKIDTDKKEISFSNGTKTEFNKLISSLPLPEIIKILENVPEDVKDAANKLRYTSGYMVSLGINKPNLAKHLWFYVYDKDIPFARVYSPSMKSPENVPAGCSSFQAEIFYGNDETIPSSDEVLQKTCESFVKMNLINESDIIVKDIRFEKYANIMFDHNIYENRQKVIDYLAQKEIISIGRFGKWEYFWSDQAFLDGKKAVESYIPTV